MSESEKSYSKLQWFFLVILIPTIFAIVLFGFILSLVGFDVVDQVKKVGSSIPGVSQLFESEEAETVIDEDQANVDELQQTIEEQQAEIDILQTDLKMKQSELDSYLAQQSKQTQSEREFENEQVEERLKELGKLYESMSPEKAASVIGQLQSAEAVQHLSKVSVETRSKIFEEMEDTKIVELLRRQLSNE